MNDCTCVDERISEESINIYAALAWAKSGDDVLNGLNQLETHNLLFIQEMIEFLLKDRKESENNEQTKH